MIGWFMICMLMKANAQLDSDDLNDIKQALSFFQGVQPSTYTVRLRLPLKNDLDNPRYTTNGNVSMIFRWQSKGIFQQPQRVIAVHSKLLIIEEKSIRLWHVHPWSGHLRRVAIENMRVLLDDEVIIFRLNDQDQLKSGATYRLDIGEFKGRIEDDGSKNAIFLTSPGLATQFQLNDARRAFPCVDIPNKKSIFKFTFVHPDTYIALFNTDLDISTKSQDSNEGWRMTSFLPTPLMSTYILGFTLIPKTFIEKASLTLNPDSKNAIRLSIFYNPDRLTNPAVASSLLKYASFAYEHLNKTFEPKLPLTKLDVCIVKGLSILGMENWGLVNLREELVQKENEIEKFGLLAHEFSHQWIGNLVTTADWRHLCVQEGLTEHYARRILGEFYGGTRSAQYQRYVFIRYLPALQNETNNIGLKPIRQDFQGFDEAVAFCFGRVPFIWAMIERISGGQHAFDKMINRFLTDFAYKNFILEDLSAYLNKTDTAAGDVLKYYVDHGGYPSLFVHRLNESMYRLRQRQIVPLINQLSQKDATFEIPSTKHVWPIPISTSNGDRLMSTSEYDLASDQMPFDQRGVPMLNPDFAYFYRVNYEADIWASIADALLSSPHSYTEMSIAQFLSDFCFFKGLNLIHVVPVDNRDFLEFLTKQFLNVQSHLELTTSIYVRFYTKGC